METVILSVHVLVTIALIGLILIQHGKGADVGAAFGSGASQTLFGSGGSGSFLTRVTTALAVVFFSTSLALAVVANQQSKQAVGLGLPSLIGEPLGDGEPMGLGGVPESGDVPVVQVNDLPSVEAVEEIPSVGSGGVPGEERSK